MTLPTAITTNGIGKVTTSHLNLTRTMADAPDLVSPQSGSRRKWERGVHSEQKNSFAGKEI